MGVTLGRHSTFWILFIFSLYLSPSNVCIGLPQDVYEKECQGTAWGLSHPTSDHSWYLEFKNMYENCTFVRDNLEIVYLELTGSEYDFSFLDSIREVNGYVLIVASQVKRIPLNGLRVIRGWNTYPMTVRLLKAERNLSLLIALNYNPANAFIGLQEIQLTSLVEITRGDVYITGNKRLCFGPRTIDWRSLMKNNRMGKITNSAYARNGLCNTTCHEKCARGVHGYCWAGERDDMCQAERPCGNCARNCSGIDCECHLECIGGCTGSNASSCVACRNFLRGDECVGNCSESKYNPDTSLWEKPPTTYIFGMRCVPECPESMVIQDGACVIACANGYKENKTNNARKCIPCREDCPKTCSGTDGDSGFLRGNDLAQFNHCKIVDGNLNIYNMSFIGDGIQPEIKLSDFEILKDVEEVIGQIEIQASHSDFSSLSFLRNLRIIGGNGHKHSSLVISGTSLKALNLKSLRQIKTGSVFIKMNPELCYAGTVNWTGLLTNTKTRQTAVVEENANSTTCKKNGLICSEKCTDLGCWGPGDDNCVPSVTP